MSKTLLSIGSVRPAGEPRGRSGQKWVVLFFWMSTSCPHVVHLRTVVREMNVWLRCLPSYCGVFGFWGNVMSRSCMK